MDKKIKNAKSTLKILGILSIVLGALGMILGALSIAGSGLLAGEMAASGGMSSAEVDTAATATGLVLIAGIVDGNILHGSEIAVTGIVHKHVDAAFRIEYALHGCHAGSVVGNIYI